jgi:hypothetical protein
MLPPRSILPNWAILAFSCLLGLSLAEESAPHPTSATDFTALQTNSPFHRSLNLSDSLILTGIAVIEGDLFATLFDRESKETHMVSRAANPQGWRMVGVAGNQAELESVTAQIALAGGEVFSVRFDEEQLKPGEAKPGGGSGGSGGSSGSSRDSNSERRDYREGISGDGHRGPPPPELVAKLSKLSEETRNKLVDKIREIRDKQQDLSSEDRQVIFDRMVDRALQEEKR